MEFLNLKGALAPRVSCIVWTQIKINDIFNKQFKIPAKKSKYFEFEESEARPESPRKAKKFP